MSVIVKCPDGLIKLYVKGADSIIKARLEPKEPQPFLEKNEEALHTFSRKGLRTLLVAMRIIEPSEYEEILARFEIISHSGDKETAICKKFRSF
jgi:magnesium-transporting ATPase (P-type)